MAERIMWDKYEAVILHDAAISVHTQKEPRAKIVKQVSESLRQMAINRGVQIDDVYRNINGVSMQLRGMEAIIYDMDSKLKAHSKLFVEIAQLYNNNRREYDALLKNAYQMVRSQNMEEVATVNQTNEKSSGSNKNSFVNWLNNNNPKLSPSVIITAFDEVSEYAVSRKLSKMSIWGIQTVRDYTFMRTALERNRLFKVLHKKAAQIFEKSWRYYATFLETLSNTEIECPTKKEADESVDSPAVTNAASITTSEAKSQSDFSLDAFYRWLSEDEKMAPATCRGYTSSLKTISEYAVKNGWLTVIIYKIANEEELRETVALLRGINDYVNFNEQQHNRFSAAIRKYLIFRTGSDVRPGRRPQKHNATAGNDKSKYFNDIVGLLKKKYKFGFRFNSAIEIIRFRQFAEIEGVALPENDWALKDEIQKAGFVVEDKVYVVDDEIAQEFIGIITGIANEGHYVIFYEALQESQTEWLMEHHIVSTDVLKELLSHNSDRFYIGRNFMTLGERMTEVEAVAYELKRVWGENSLLDFSAMSSRLPMIPLDRIKHAISYSTDFVWNSEETYAFLDRVIISDAEKNAIIEFVQNTCENVGYASLSDIPMGAIAEVNYELSNTALYNAIYNKVLLGKFYLNGKILTATESTISAVSLVKAYCANKNECTFDELADRVVELTGGTNRQYAFEAAYDTMVRVDANRFVADQYVNFEIDTIDALLDEFVKDDFISIKGIATFALFPFCGQSWNYYLLESFCYRFSKKYSLHVMNFNDKNAGIISKKSCHLNYKEMLAIVISQADIPLTVESAGAYLFSSGYMAKRKYGDMNTILQRAKELRERND